MSTSLWVNIARERTMLLVFQLCNEEIVFTQRCILHVAIQGEGSECRSFFYSCMSHGVSLLEENMAACLQSQVASAEGVFSWGSSAVLSVHGEFN